MENYQKQVKQVVDILKGASTDIESVFTDPEIVHLRGRILRILGQEISSLSLQHGIEYDVKNTENTIGSPLKRIMGRVIEVAGPGPEKQLLSEKPVQCKAIQQSAQEIEANELRVGVHQLYAKFTDIENEAILDQFDDMVIRGVGKVAGLPVTGKHPKKVDFKFIDEIKDAIKKKHELENVGTSDDQNKDGKNADDLGDDNAGEEELKKTLAGKQSAQGSEAKGGVPVVNKAVVDGPVNVLNQKSGGDTKTTDAKKNNDHK